MPVHKLVNWLISQGFMTMHVSLWAWWEVVAAQHRAHDYVCCHLQADCLKSGISSGLAPTLDYEDDSFTFRPSFTFTFTAKKRNGSILTSPGLA